jgi:hypothetical protein
MYSKIFAEIGYKWENKVSEVQCAAGISGVWRE